VLDKGKALGQVLLGHGQLSAQRLQLLEALVGDHLRRVDPQVPGDRGQVCRWDVVGDPARAGLAVQPTRDRYP
jgi:hypothetical protein